MDLILSHTLGLLVVAIVVAIVARRVHLPYTVGLVAAGACLALAHAGVQIPLTEELIFDVILPPLLFEAALCIRWSELAADSLPVVVLATVGVVFSACVVAAGLVFLLGVPVIPALTFGVPDCRDRPCRGHCHVQGYRHWRPRPVAGGERKPAE